MLTDTVQILVEGLFSIAVLPTSAKCRGLFQNKTGKVSVLLQLTEWA